MTQGQESTESPAPRPLFALIAVLVVGVMFVAYVYAYIRVNRHELLMDNLEWMRTVVANLLP